MPAFGPTISKSLGTTSICTSSLRSSRIVFRELVVRRVGERDDHALDVEQRDDVAQAVGRPDERQVLELGTARPRMRVDEADEIDAVLGVLEELPRSQLSDVARADDDRVLEVERAAARARARESRASS